VIGTVKLGAKSLAVRGNNYLFGSSTAPGAAVSSGAVNFPSTGPLSRGSKKFLASDMMLRSILLISLGVPNGLIIKTPVVEVLNRGYTC